MQNTTKGCDMKIFDLIKELQSTDCNSEAWAICVKMTREIESEGGYFRGSLDNFEVCCSVIHNGIGVEIEITPRCPASWYNIFDHLDDDTSEELENARCAIEQIYIFRKRYIFDEYKGYLA